MSTSLPLLAAEHEADFWQALHQGRHRAARQHAAALCALPNQSGATEMDVRCSTSH